MKSTITKPLTERQRLDHNEAQRKWRRKVKSKPKNDRKGGRGRPACNYTEDEKRIFKRVKEKHKVQIKRLKKKLASEDLSQSEKNKVIEKLLNEKNC